MTDGSFLSPSPVADPLSLAEHERAYADLADAVRELIDATVRTRIAFADAGTVAADVRAITQELLATAQPGPLGLVTCSDGRLRDHGNPAVGSRNPIAPPLVIGKDRAAQRTWCDFVLGAAYEGPPGHVHGGVVALVLDQVLGTLPAVIGKPGFTAYLTTTYRRLTPLGPLHAEAWRSVEGAQGPGRGPPRRTTTTADAEGLFVIPAWVEDALRQPVGDAGDFDPPN
ncbi:MAG: PaaI family thioesterase [Actinomycetales bacterium]|nr:PaaI family thioesterase [Candidatus Lutibacillus vidarii]